MSCGGCNKSKTEYQKKIEEQRSIERIKRQPDVRNIAKKYYNPDEDPNYKLIRRNDEMLTEKQKRIKHRIIRMEKRSLDKAFKEYQKNKF